MSNRFNIELFTENLNSEIFFRINKERRRIGLREFSEEIGISASTLSRLSKGKMPDTETFFKVIKWMNSSPIVYTKIN